MRMYVVVVRNELTGEVVTVSCDSTCVGEAQVSALTQLFYSQGWRKATALQPVYELPMQAASHA